MGQPAQTTNPILILSAHPRFLPPAAAARAAPHPRSSAARPAAVSQPLTMRYLVTPCRRGERRAAADAVTVVLVEQRLQRAAPADVARTPLRLVRPGGIRRRRCGSSALAASAAVAAARASPPRPHENDLHRRRSGGSAGPDADEPAAANGLAKSDRMADVDLHPAADAVAADASRLWRRSRRHAAQKPVNVSPGCRSQLVDTDRRVVHELQPSTSSNRSVPSSKCEHTRKKTIGFGGKDGLFFV